MSDYINREDAIKANENYVPYQRLGEDRQSYMDRILKELPSADVVEVVRCRDCEHWECNPGTDRYGSCQKVAYDDFEVIMEGDDFCSYGERKEHSNE